jgi:heterodisulfide reductase subunit A
VNILYTDIRSNFKGYEEFYRRARDLGVNFIHGKASLVLEDPKTKNLTTRVEDISIGQPLEIESEMVVLCTAAIPKKGADEVARVFGISRGSGGFFMESHPKLKPIDTPTDGIFVAGACQGPKTYLTA